MLGVLLAAVAMAGEVTLTLAPSQPSFVIGEPVWISVLANNQSAEPVDLRLGYHQMVDRQGTLLVRAYDAAGALVADPHDLRMVPPFGNPPQHGVVVAPGAAGAVTVDLNAYAWLDEPGTYRVRALHPLDSLWTWREPPAEADRRWLEATVTMTAPTAEQARRAVTAHLPERPLYGPEGPSAGAEELHGLGHARFVPALEEYARERADPHSIGPSREILALHRCPCPEATAALLRLLAVLEEAERLAVAEALLERIPPHWRRSSTWFQTSVWAPELEVPLRAAARHALETEPWPGARLWGARVFRRLGPGPDLELLMDALDEALEADRRDVAQALAALLAAGDPAWSRTLATLLQASGVPYAPGTEVLAALRSGRPVLIETALADLRDQTDAMVAEIAPLLTHPDEAVARAARRHAGRHPHPAYGPQLIEALGSVPDPELQWAFDAAGRSGSLAGPGWRPRCAGSSPVSRTRWSSGW